MFVDFDKVFNNKPQTELQVPDALVKYLSNQLPDGVKYVCDSSGNCQVTSETDSFTMGGFVFKPTKEQLKVLGKNFTHEDVLSYLYNTQKPIQLTLKKQGYITLNGQDFPIEKMSYNPLNPVKYVDGTLFMTPRSFPKPFTITVGNNEYERKLKVARIPNNSVHIASFSSSEDEPLKLELFLNQKDETMCVNISFNLSKAKSIQDIVEITSIFNSYLDGKGTMYGQHLPCTITPSDAKKYDEESIIFWKKLLVLENILDIIFKPPFNDIDYNTLCLVEELYQNLYKQTPIRNDQKIQSISGNWEMNSKEELAASLGKSAFFEFEASSNINLLGHNLQLPCIISIFNAVLSDYQKENSKYTLSLDDESPTNKMYTSVLHFVSDEKLEEYKSLSFSDRTSAFHNAKRARDYL